MKYGDLINGTITDIDDKGRGVFPAPAPSTGLVVVAFAAIGDTVEAEFYKRDAGVKLAKLKTVVSPAKERIESSCPHAGQCGGCLWQHLGYEAQLTLKQSMINRTMTKHGHQELIKSIEPCPDQFYYRNRMDYVIGWKSEVGLKEFGSWNRYLDLKTCLLLDKKTPEILQTIRDLMKELAIEPWDAKTYQGQLRYVLIRQGKFTQETLINLIVKDKNRFDDTQKQRILEKLNPFCTSLLIGENPKQTDLSICESFEILKGELYVHERINDLTYHIHPNSFFQTNSIMAEQLQTYVMQLIQKIQPTFVLDLYCGLGFFGIACAKQNIQIAGYEIDAQAIELAKENAKLNNVEKHCEFTAGPAEDLSWTHHPADTVILDPPRAGMHPKALKAVLAMAPKNIIYVSCNYHRLAEELKIMKQTYSVESMQALDLFPQTPHVEVVAHLKLNV